MIEASGLRSTGEQSVSRRKERNKVDLQKHGWSYIEPGVGSIVSKPPCCQYDNVIVVKLPCPLSRVCLNLN